MRKLDRLISEMSDLATVAESEAKGDVYVRRREFLRRLAGAAGLAAGAAALGPLAACGGDGVTNGNGGPPPAPPPPPPPPPPGPVVPGADVTINMDNIAFIDPDGNENTQASVTIDVGQTVGWVNSDSEFHTVTSGEGVSGNDGDGLPEGADAIASGNLAPGDEFSHTFEVAGTYTVYCEFHPTQMFDATIIVQ